MHRIAITETEGGWTDGTTLWATAVDAEQAARAASAARADQQGGVDVLVIDWHPTTRVGKLVVRAITGT